MSLLIIHFKHQLNTTSLDETFTDECGGKDTNRLALKELIKFVRKDDTVNVHDISRMARNTENLLALTKWLTDKGVKLIFKKKSLTLTGDDNPMEELMLIMLGKIYQFERSMMLKRQRKGIEFSRLVKTETCKNILASFFK